MDKFHFDRIERVRAFPRRTFHDLVTLSHLAAWGLGPLPTAENLNHEETTCRSEYPQFIFPFFIFVVLFLLLLFFFFFFFNLIFLFAGIITMRENREKNITSGDEDAAVTPVVQKTSV